MDAEWAVVAGAALGAIGAVIGTTLGSFFSDRRSAKLSGRIALRDALEAAIVALIAHGGNASRPDQAAKWSSGETFMLAAARVGLHLRRGESEVDSVLVGTYAAINQDPSGAARYAGAVAHSLPAWFRGDITIKELTRVKQDWPESMQEQERRWSAER